MDLNRKRTRERVNHSTLLVEQTLVSDSELALDEANVSVDAGLNHGALVRDGVHVEDRCFEQVRSGSPVTKHLVCSRVVHRCTRRVLQGFTSAHAL